MEKTRNWAQEKKEKMNEAIKLVQDIYMVCYPHMDKAPQIDFIKTPPYEVIRVHGRYILAGATSVNCLMAQLTSYLLNDDKSGLASYETSLEITRAIKEFN